MNIKQMRKQRVKLKNPIIIRTKEVKNKEETMRYKKRQVKLKRKKEKMVIKITPKFVFYDKCR